MADLNLKLDLKAAIASSGGTVSDTSTSTSTSTSAAAAPPTPPTSSTPATPLNDGAEPKPGSAKGVTDNPSPSKKASAKAKPSKPSLKNIGKKVAMGATLAGGGGSGGGKSGNSTSKSMKEMFGNASHTPREHVHLSEEVKADCWRRMNHLTLYFSTYST